MTRTRAVHTILAALERGPLMKRLLGSVDLRGQGTAFEPTALGPFVLVEDARHIHGRGQPTFGAHPHSGLLVASYIADGGPWRSRSNAPGYEDLSVPAGTALLTFSGRGVEHDERTDSEGEHALLQMILRLPTSARDRAPWLRHLTPAEVAPGLLRVFDRDSLEGTDIDAALWHASLDADARVTLTLPASHTHGFVYARQGSARVAGASLPEGSLALLDQRGVALELEAEAGPCELFIATGADIDEPWVKLLGHEGFVIAPDEASAQAKLDAYAAEPRSFGQSTSMAPM